MLREEYLRRLVDDAHIELYLSSNDGARLYWPWRMQPPKEASTTYRNACEKYIIDSDPLDDSVTTTDVLDTAVATDAEVASLQDIYQDKDATVDTLLEGLATADKHAFDGELLLPLQEPVEECWREIGEPKQHWIGIGGLKGASEQERLDAVRRLREVAGNDIHIHGFGWGPGQELAKALRKNPGLLDSTDYSTPMQQSIKSDDMAGEERMSVQAMRAGRRLIQDLRRVTDFVNEDTSQQSLGDW